MKVAIKEDQDTGRETHSAYPSGLHKTANGIYSNTVNSNSEVVVWHRYFISKWSSQIYTFLSLRFFFYLNKLPQGSLTGRKPSGPPWGVSENLSVDAPSAQEKTLEGRGKKGRKTQRGQEGTGKGWKSTEG